MAPDHPTGGFAARRAFRAHTREVLQAPHDISRHLARLHAALQLPGAEPAQGALADLFVAVAVSDTGARKAALGMVEGRLDPYAFDAFQRHPRGLVTVTPLASRWSVIAQPSAEVPARVRRGSSDDSRRLAREVVNALHSGELMEASRIEAAFLGHCVSCQDKLAFMLAMRGLRLAGIEIDDRWRRVDAWLQQRDAYGEHQGEPARDAGIAPSTFAAWSATP